MVILDCLVSVHNCVGSRRLLSRSFLILLLIVNNTGLANEQISSMFNQPEFSKKIVPDFIFTPFQDKSVLPAYHPEQPLSDSAEKFTITRIKIQGNTVLTKQQILPIIKPYIGKRVSMGDLQQLRYGISALYFEQGYVNSGVVLPDQQIIDGVVVFHAIEGELSKIHLMGNNTLSNRYILNLLAHGTSKPLNVNSLKQSIQLLERDPLVASVQARLYPTDRLGESELSLEIRENKPYQIILGIDNYRSPIIGSERGWINLQHNNLLGKSDVLTGQFGLTEGLQDFTLSYSFHVNKINSKFNTYYQNTDSRLISEEAQSLDIENQTSILGLVWLYQTSSYKLLPDEIALGLEKINSHTTVTNLKIDNQITSLNASASWSTIMSDAVLKFSSGLTLGEGIQQSELAGNENSQYALLSFSSLYQRHRKNEFSQWDLKTRLQLANESLPGIAKISLGGATSVRGYRENTLNRDNGVIINLEHLSPIWNRNLQLALFMDYGLAWNQSSASNQEQLLSFGAGFSWRGIKKLNTELMLGVPLLNRSDETNNLQDFGIHFGIQYTVF